MQRNCSDGAKCNEQQILMSSQKGRYIQTENYGFHIKFSLEGRQSARNILPAFSVIVRYPFIVHSPTLHPCNENGKNMEIEIDEEQL